MSTDVARSVASVVYAEAHATHYQRRDLLRALRIYHRVIALYPGAPEAAHSRTQIRNIVNMAVPADELLSALSELALHHLELDRDANGPL